MDAGEIIQERYELTGLLGRGGMAEVWRAADRRLNRDVAIKLLAPELADDPEFLVRFFSEAQAVARISHPNVVKILDFGDHDGRPFLVMETVEGGTVADIVGNPVQPERAFELIAGATIGAAAAHEQAVVHRDIKPGNILLTEEGTPKLADFGIAASGRSERLTATGQTIGSPHYISPEQASRGEATPASDVYSLGVVLYELLTGVRPFEGDNVTAIAIAHVDQEPVTPSAHVPDLPPQVDALVLRCLAKDPAVRFASAADLAHALQHPEVSGAVVAGAEPAPGHHPRRALVAAVAALLLATAGAATLLASGDQDVAVADGDETLANVGGLQITFSPTPTSSSAPRRDSTPSPSETEDEEENEEDEPARKTQGRSGSNSGSSSEEPEPTPEPTEGDPTPEPTGDAESTPAP